MKTITLENKTFDVFEKEYRLLKKKHQEIIKQKVKDVVDTPYLALDEALWDSNPTIWHSHGEYAIFSNPKNFFEKLIEYRKIQREIIQK